MADIEKVIKGLELCEIGSDDRCYETECPYYGKGCTESLKNDILALLKEQEAVKPTLIREGWNKHFSHYVCPRCDDEVVYEQNYCSECGVRFLWEGL